MKRTVLFFLSILLSFAANAAFVTNMPTARLQPNGDTLHCFVTGDEFYQRLHDSNNYTIVQDRNTGWYVYASIEWSEDHSDWRLVPTTHIAGIANPATAGLTPGLSESPATIDARHKSWDIPTRYIAPGFNQHGTKNAAKVGENNGKLNNVVIFIRFADDSAITTPYSTIHDMFNDSSYNAVSMHNYFWHASYQKLRIPTYFYPQPIEDSVISYQDIYPRSYYIPYNSATNTNGYADDYERRSREFGLLERAVNYINQNSPIPTSLNIDRDNDGYVDNICFIVKGTYTSWNDLLWPHKWALYDREVYINGKRVYTFNLQLEGSGSHYFSTSTFCHEMFHTLGAPDLYHYNNYTNITGVGTWDLMCSNTQPPQHMSIFMKMRYGGWIDSVPELTEAGTYSLHSVGDSMNQNNCYRIQAGSPDQWYFLEYRDNTELFETGLPGKGLIIYRIDTRFNGNSNFNALDIFDEVYLFRPNALNDTSNGNYAQAYFSLESGRTQFNTSTNPYPWLNGNVIDTTLSITDVGSAGETISFTYTPHRPTTPPCDTNSCTISVEMRDSYGDTWHGAYLSFTDANGNTLANMSIGDCKTLEQRTLTVCNGPIHVQWHPGAYGWTCGYTIRLGDGSVWRNVGSASEDYQDLGYIFYPCGGTVPQYTVTVESNYPSNHVSGGGTYNAGTSANISAEAVTHYNFLGWHDGPYNPGDDLTLLIDNFDRNRTVTVLSDTLFTAVFIPDMHEITLFVNDASMGTVQGGRTYFYGDTAILTAYPNAGYKFVRWVCGTNQYTDNPLKIVVRKSEYYTAFFEPEVGIQSCENGVATYSKGKEIIVDGAIGHSIEIFDVLGRPVFSGTQENTCCSYTVPSTGIYMVHIEGLPVKKIVVIGK